MTSSNNNVANVVQDVQNVKMKIPVLSASMMESIFIMESVSIIATQTTDNLNIKVSLILNFAKTVFRTVWFVIMKPNAKNAINKHT